MAPLTSEPMRRYRAFAIDSQTLEQMERAPMSVDLPGPFESERRP